MVKKYRSEQSAVNAAYKKEQKAPKGVKRETRLVEFGTKKKPEWAVQYRDIKKK